MWDSGPVIRTVSSSDIPSSRANGSTDSSSAGWVETMSFGRPVLPPDVGAFNEAAAASPSGASDSPGWGSKPAGIAVRPAASSGSTPTTRLGSASSMIACRSRAGSREDTGWGVAPHFHVAMAASRNSTVFGRPIVTNESRVTPSCW